MHPDRLAAIAFALVAVAPATAQQSAPPTGLEENLHFQSYGTLARSSEIMRRVFTPLTAAEIRGNLARSGKRLNEAPLALDQESFLATVPPAKPPGGYGLLVFVPPWQKAQIPQGWKPVLDAMGMIFVTAARSGNEEDVVSRREPLALIAAENMLARYDIDRAKIFVGGMSGGARMALRLALAYPDLFRGAFLNSDSDVIGTLVEPLPPAPLFRQFQTGTRLLYITGDHDAANLEQENRSRSSMRDWCVSDTSTIRMTYTGHEVAPAAVLRHGFEILLDPVHPDPAPLQSCRARIDADVAAGLDEVDALIKSGKRRDAMRRLKDIDSKYGGLAAPRSLDLYALLTDLTP